MHSVEFVVKGTDLEDTTMLSSGSDSDSSSGNSSVDVMFSRDVDDNHHHLTNNNNNNNHNNNNGNDGHVSPKKIRKLSYYPVDDNEDEMMQEIARSRSTADCNLSALQLQVLPAASLPLGTLTKLSLSENQLTSLPAEMFAGNGCHNLRELDVNSNLLVTVPAELFLLPRLEVLMLNHNNIESLPPLCDDVLRPVGSNTAARKSSNSSNNHHLFLPSLQRVGLEFNSLRSFPVCFFQRCPHLQEVLLGNNEPMLDARVPLETLLGSPLATRDGSKPVLLKLDNRPRFVEQMRKEDWVRVLPWMCVELHKIYPDKVLDFLFLGSMRTAQTVRVYHDCDIRYVLTIGRDLEVTIEEGMEHKVLPIDDYPGEDIAAIFTEAFHFIDEARASKKGVLIHCFAGLSRSVTIAAAYIMQTQRVTFVDAMATIKRARPAARPNEGFIACLKEYETQLMSGRFAN